MKTISILAALSIAVLTAGAIGERHATAQLPDLSGDTSTATTSISDGLQPRVASFVKVSRPMSGNGCSLIDASGPHLAVDPANPKHLAMVYQLGDIANDATKQVAVVADSYDGGSDWTRAMLSGMTLCSNGPNGVVGDPFIAIGGNGRVAATETWQSWDPLPTDTSDARLFLSRSDDNGATFGSPLQPEDTINPNGNQRGPLLFDPQSPSTMYLAFERIHYLNEADFSPLLGGAILGLGGSVAVAKYDEGNSSLSVTDAFKTSVTDAFKTLPGEEALTVALLKSGSDLVVIGYIVEDSDYLQALAVAASNQIGPRINPTLRLSGPPVPEHLIAVRSTDDGATFGSPEPVVKWVPGDPAFGTSDRAVGDNSPATIGTYNFSGFTGCCIPDASAGPESSMYVTWTDAATNGVFLARSNDGGRSWSGGDQPAFTVPGGALESAVAARADGSVGIFYYAVTDERTITPFIAISRDGLSGWTTIPIAKAFDLSKLTGGSFDGVGPIGPGPYQDIVALPDGFGVAVTLNNPKDPTLEEVFYAKVTVSTK
jgi:hypothetical protein